ncbi:MAG: peptidoglycan DD-metalloendopeptidase family protein [Nitrospinae bacterium]|nr:peptidoglycan DD-metalloendopeptidase family protein [Nitrospinota bacterium]
MRKNFQFSIFNFQFLLIAYCLLLTAYCFAGTVDELNKQIDKERGQLKEIGDKIDKQRLMVSVAKKNENSILSVLNMTNRSLKIIEKEIKVYELKLSEAQQKKMAIENRLKEIETMINRQKKFLSERLRILYKEGNLSYIKVALSATDLTDFFQRMRYMEKIAEYDSKIIKDFFEKQKEMEGYKLSLIKSTEELLSLKNAADKKKKQMLEEKKEKEKLLGKIKGKRAVYEQIQEELEDSSQQLMSLIETLEKKRREAEARLPSKKAGDFAVLKGSLPWPISGNIVSTFGKIKEPRFNTYLFNNGIEIGSSSGANVKAIHSGDIIFADWFKGYGKLIIIDHGDGYYSLYGHLDEIGAAVGEKIQSGDIIGKVGDTDSINGYTLYFEIRQRGKPEDPMAWFAPRKIVKN